MPLHDFISVSWLWDGEGGLVLQLIANVLTMVCINVLDKLLP